MGNASSRSTKTKSIPNGETIGGGMARGKTVETQGEDIAHKIELVVEEEFPSDESYLAEESDMSSSDDEEDEEEDEEMMERLRVLDDARKLKQLAQAFLYPERPVVTTSETACARNYFNRASAPDASMEEERARILEDVAALKKLAVDYAHPEISVVTTDENACGRNYFDRASAVEQESVEESEERAKILEDVDALKKLAMEYAHPEVPVVTTDENACGRNYFGRASAISREEADERTRVLEDMLALKKRAVQYMHPELTVISDPEVYGRNFYDRASAPVVESLEDAAERARVMDEMHKLKQLATDYLHPELSVFTTDDTACGRLYFNRSSAAETEEEDEERDLIMEDLKALKKLAADYLHPEKSVVTTDETACARNYFNRPSAEDVESMEEAEERARIMEEAMSLKKLAVDYLHPEKRVVTTDDTACARNYFNRPSALDTESMEEAEERAHVLEDATALKKLAVEYSHPELPVVADSTVYARGYFGRFSAPEQLSAEEAEEYDRFIADAMNLKKFAVDYLHPEASIVTSDDTATARNFFGRASAKEIESAEEAEERARILEEMQILKKLATDYHHPELSCVTTDATACGRNYYDRSSAPGHKCISTTRTVEEPTKFIEHEIEDDHYLDEDGFHFAFEDDEEFVSDLKYNVHRLLDPIHHSFNTLEEQAAQKPMDLEEEGKLSRSPSSVMLFGGPYEIS